jgi:hypothetical protein
MQRLDIAHELEKALQAINCGTEICSHDEAITIWCKTPESDMDREFYITLHIQRSWNWGGDADESS